MKSSYEDGAFYNQNTRVNPFLIEHVNGLPAGQAIDFGCGVGTNSGYLLSRGWNVLGIDVEDIALDMAGKKLNGNIFRQDLRAIEWDALPDFNLALCNYVIQHLSITEASTFLNDLAAHLASRGWLFLSVFDRENVLCFSEAAQLLANVGLVLQESKNWKRWDYDHGPAHFHVGTEAFFLKC